MSLQIFILGILCEGHRHPYDIKKIFKQENIAPEVKVSDGTLYYHFEALAKQKYIERIMVSKEENRPERTLYGITDLGREALVEMIYKSFRTFKDITNLYAPILFLHHASKERVIGLIEDCMDAINKKIHRYDKAWSTVPKQHENHPTVRNAAFLHEHSMSRARVDLEWLGKILDYAKAM
ncbi:PadR family transcriptional regulator [Cohnella sp. AR92]|uniref:PadR family transcriptional regulator n=1 Tax=Cohnella sp. AR92 TaxID=648716 RepID=UPI000F8D9FE4|nr:PadR family transcriptional regulator [Cohnella sp. AR92]RUS49023.1 PadR family transcriptional regulator [Cohnella sp. AR92]